MTDPIEEIVAPAAIERAMSVFERFKERDHCEPSQARKALRDFVFGQVAKGETDEKRLVVAEATDLAPYKGFTPPPPAFDRRMYSPPPRSQPESGRVESARTRLRLQHRQHPVPSQ